MQDHRTTRELRCGLGLRVAELARLAGVSSRTVAKVENGERVDPDLATDVELALAATELALERPADREVIARMLPGEPFEGWAA